MSRLVEQLARLFVEPQATGPVSKADVRWLPPAEAAGTRTAAACERIAVVCAPRDARMAGGAAALALAQAGGASSVAVLDWAGEERVSGGDRPASLAARRCAARLRAAEHAATAVGRLVRVALPGDDEAAAAAARGAIAQAGLPSVLVAAAARGPAIERLLAEQDLILLAGRPGADEELTALALPALERLAPCAVVELRPSPAAAALARTGTALVAPLRTRFLQAMSGGLRGEAGQVL